MRRLCRLARQPLRAIVPKTIPLHPCCVVSEPSLNNLLVGGEGAEPREVRIHGRPFNGVTGLKSKFYNHAGDVCTVEELALEHYKLNGNWNGSHSENGIWCTLFGLLMWDIIFHDVPNVFLTPWQTAPLDLGKALKCKWMACA